MWPEATEVGGTVLTCHLSENARNTKILLAVEGWRGKQALITAFPRNPQALGALVPQWGQGGGRAVDTDHKVCAEGCVQRRGRRSCPCRGGIRNQDKPLPLGGRQDLPVRWGQKTLLPGAPAPLLSRALGTVSSGFLLRAPAVVRNRVPLANPGAWTCHPISQSQDPGLHADSRDESKGKNRGRTEREGEEDERHGTSGRRAPITRFKPLPSLPGCGPPAAVAVRESTSPPSTSPSPLPGPRTEAVNRLLPGQWENETRCQR